jgi:hypothetical protein
MPNIEIHGYGLLSFDVPTSSGDYQTHIDGKAYSLREIIWGLFSNEPYKSDMVITVFPSHVSDERFYRQPFLRIVSTPSPFLNKIIELLKQLNIDIEVLELKAFHPKKTEGTNI